MFKPLADRVLVRLDTVQSMTPGGLVLPDSAKPAPDTGVVVAVGPGKADADGTSLPMTVQAGDRVMFARYAGERIALDPDDEAEYVVVREGDLYGVLED